MFFFCCVFVLQNCLLYLCRKFQNVSNLDVLTKLISHGEIHCIFERQYTGLNNM